MSRRRRREPDRVVAAGTASTTATSVVSESVPQRPGRSGERWLAAAALLLPLLVFAPSLFGGFLNWDDPSYLVSNFRLRTASAMELFRLGFEPHASNWHPLTWWVHGAAFRIFGEEPAGHHAIPWMLHAINGALVFLIALRLLRRAWPVGGAAAVGALLASLAFSIHPQRVESVAWVAETKDVLFAFFSLLAARSHLEAIGPDGRLLPGGRRWGAVTLFGALALLSKPMAVTLPAALTILHLALDRERPLATVLSESSRRLAALWGAAVAVAGLELSAAGERVVSAGQLSFGERLVVALRAPGFYLSGFLLPRNLSPLVPIDAAKRLDLVTASCLLLTVLVTLVALRRFRHPLSLAWVAALAMIGPVSGILQVGPQGAADRFTYLAQVGFALAVGGAITARLSLPEGGRARRAAFPVVVVVAWLAGLAVVTGRYIPVFASPEALWSRALLVFPESGVAWSNLGSDLQDRGRRDEARAAFERAVRFAPTDPGILANLAGFLVLEGELEAAAPWADRAVSLSPGNSWARATRGQLRLETGDPSGALVDYDASLAVEPDQPDALAGRARAKLLLGDAPGAEHDLDRALGFEPDNPVARIHRAIAFASTGRTSEARRELDRLLANGTLTAEALVNRGILAAMEGDRDRARSDFAAAQRIDAGSEEAAYNALLLARLEGRDAEATRLERRLDEMRRTRSEAREPTSSSATAGTRP